MSSGVFFSQRDELCHDLLEIGEGIVVDFVACGIDTGVPQLIQRRFASAFGEELAVRRDISFTDLLHEGDGDSHAQRVLVDIEVVVEMRHIIETISL